MNTETVNGKEYDMNIWKKLQVMSDGYVPLVKREYYFTGSINGQQCRFPVELTERHSSLMNYYGCHVKAASNALYQPDWVNLANLIEIV